MALKEIPVNLIRENTEALRTEVEKDSISYQELVASIRSDGVLLPILVREETDPTTGNLFYPLVDGLQRFTAACEVGLESVPAQITTIAANKVLATQIMTNAVRVNTPDAQFATALKKMMQLDPALTKDELGKQCGKSGGWVDGMLKLTKLLPHIQKLVNEGKLTCSNGQVLSTLPQDKQDDFLQSALSEANTTFGPRITEALKEIRSAARQGRPTTPVFTPIESVRKVKDIRGLHEAVKAGNTVELEGILNANGATTPVEAAKFMLAYYFNVDPQSVAAQKAKWDADQAEKKANRDKQAADREAAREAKAKADLAASAAKLNQPAVA